MTRARTRALVVGLVAAAALPAVAYQSFTRTQGTLADCAPAFLAMDPGGSGYHFTAILTDGASHALWDRTWGFPTPARCREAYTVAMAIQRVLLIPTLTITECQ